MALMSLKAFLLRKFVDKANCVIRARAVFAWAVSYGSLSRRHLRSKRDYAYCSLAACVDHSEDCSSKRPVALYSTSYPPDHNDIDTLICVCRAHRGYISDGAPHLHRKLWGFLSSEIPSLKYYKTPVTYSGKGYEGPTDFSKSS